MLKGTRVGTLTKIQPISIHGQLSCDLYGADVNDPAGQVHVVSVGPEALPHHLEPGDRIQIEYVVGVAVRVVRASPE
jgi:hypothetical protein